MKDFLDAAPLATFSVLNLTVLERGLKFQLIKQKHLGLDNYYLKCQHPVYFLSNFAVPTLSHSDHISNLDISEAGRQVD